jgi:hypothetical protein
MGVQEHYSVQRVGVSAAVFDRPRFSIAFAGHVRGQNASVRNRGLQCSHVHLMISAPSFASDIELGQADLSQHQGLEIEKMSRDQVSNFNRDRTRCSLLIYRKKPGPDASGPCVYSKPGFPYALYRFGSTVVDSAKLPP